MLRDDLDVSVDDPGHVRFRDGVAFHVRSGETSLDQDCRCGTGEPVFEVKSYREAVPQLQLSLTDSCNMACSYCAFRDRVHADGKPVTIPLDTVREGLEFYRNEVMSEDARY